MSTQDDLDESTQNDVDTTNAAPPASAKSIKAFGAKKGPKLARGRGKPSVTLNTKVGAKKASQKPGGSK